MNKYLRIPQYEPKGFPKDNINKVQSLYRKSFGGRELTIPYIQWQMLQNPCLKERAVTLWQGETLVGYNALNSSPVILYGKKAICADSGNTMVDEEFLGASIQLIQEVLRQNKDIDIIIGFPNRNSFGIYVRYLHFPYVGDMAFWTAEAKDGIVSEEIKEFYSFTNEYEQLSWDLAKHHDFIKLRNMEFLNYRFFQKPEFDYKGYELIHNGVKHGYIIVDIYEENGIKQLQVIDILADSIEVFKSLLKFATQLAWQWNCPFVKLWLSSEFYKAALEESGFIYGEHPFRMIVFNQNLDLSKCYITLADSDIF